MIKSTLQLAIRPLARTVISPVKKSTVLPCIQLIDIRNIHITSNASKELRQGKEKLRVKPEKPYVAEGEGVTNISLISDSVDTLFPDISTPNKIFDDVPYNKLHIINIKTTKNNTIMTLTDHRGQVIITHSAGVEGFKNTRKGTNVAAQQTANVLGLRGIEKGIKTVRVRIQGLGPGRAGALKGLQLSGMNVVSLTDDTRVSWNPPRPRKQRRI